MKPMPTSARLAGPILALVLTSGLLSAITFFARTCDYGYRDERELVIAALAVPLLVSLGWLLYGVTQAMTSWSSVQSLRFAVGGSLLSGLAGVAVLLSSDIYANCYS